MAIEKYGIEFKGIRRASGSLRSMASPKDAFIGS
jgi:hypothetical protein